MHRLVFYIILFHFSFAFGQVKNNGLITFKKVGILYNEAKQNNFLFTDRDYNYKTNLLKFQFFYQLNNNNNWRMNLVAQPQIQSIKHQLLNEYFITPEDVNYEYYREKFTQKKHISLYAFELGLQVSKWVYKNLSFEAMLGLGVGYIDVETERLARGFTFIENISLGLVHSLNNSEIYVGSNFGHISNLNIKLPNSGYNILGFEIGYRIFIQ